MHLAGEPACRRSEFSGERAVGIGGEFEGSHLLAVGIKEGYFRRMVGHHAVCLSISRIFHDNPFEIYGLARAVYRAVSKQECMYVCLFLISVVSAIRPEIPVGTQRIAMCGKHDTADVALALIGMDGRFAIFVCRCFADNLIPVAIKGIVPPLVEERYFRSPYGHSRFTM